MCGVRSRSGFSRGARGEDLIDADDLAHQRGDLGMRLNHSAGRLSEHLPADTMASRRMSASGSPACCKLARRLRR